MKLVAIQFKSALIFAAFIAAMVMFGSVSSAKASNPNIIFENAPLFNEISFVPNQETTRWVKVKNVASEAKLYGAKLGAFSDLGNLSSQLNLTITRGATVLYNNTLLDFYNGGEIALSSVNPGETVQYDFKIVFKPQADNNYQEKMLTFDISVGILGAGDSGGTGGGGSGSGSFSGGGSNSILPIKRPIQVLGEEGWPQLTMSKSVDKKYANPGQKMVNYTLVLTNNGTLTAFAVNITDNLPAGLYFNGTTETTKLFELGDLAPGEIKTINYAVEIAENARTNTYINTATAIASNHDPVSATASLEVRSSIVAGMMLAATGFELNELLIILFCLTFIIMTIRILKKKTS